jgi:SPP1 gp7 family putative phage head morphogenesis protein
MTASERIRDLAIKHGVYLERYTRREIREVIKILEQSADEIVKKIESTGGEWTKKRLYEVLSDTKRILQTTFGSVADKTKEDFNELAVYEIGKVERDFISGLPVKIDTTSVAPEQLLSAIQSLPASQGSTLGELMDGWSRNTVQRFVSAIRLGVVQGETVQQMIVRVRGRSVGRGRYEGGVLKTTTRGAAAYVRTAVAHVNNTARQTFYEDNDDIIKGLQYVATLDNRTCLQCGPLDGQVFAVDGSKPDLPQHPNCRCLYAPVVKSWEELGIDLAEAPDGTRASMDGQVPDKTTYQDWLKRQSKETQEDVLGIQRAALFRSGKPLDDMIDASGNVLTLKQMQALDK